MRTLSIVFFSVLFLLIATGANAQSKKETFKVSGECGMCKTKIEAAAKTAGARFANWNTETHELTVSYASGKTSAAKIQQAIAAVGYDTPTVLASDAAYNALHECCKYERVATEKAGCCKKGEGKADCCSADGSCKEGKDCCAADGSCKDGKDCCTAKEGADKNCCKSDATAEKSCCKKS